MPNTQANGQKDLSIHGEKFTITAPYAEGHVLTAAEAKTLNQVRGENIANNFRSAVRDALDGKGEGLDAVRQQFAEYDAKYNFSMGGSRREPVDPVEREATAIAKAALKELIREQKGMSLKDYLAVEGNQEKYDANVERISAQDDVLKEAKKRVAQRKKTVASTAEIGL